MVTKPDGTLVAGALREPLRRTTFKRSTAFSPLSRARRAGFRCLCLRGAIRSWPAMPTCRPIALAATPPGLILGWRGTPAISDRRSEPVNGQARELLYGSQRAIVGRRDHHQSGTCAPGATGTADAMNVVLGVMRDVKIEDVAHVRNIEATGGHIAGNKQLHLVGAEAVQSLHT